MAFCPKVTFFCCLWCLHLSMVGLRFHYSHIIVWIHKIASLISLGQLQELPWKMSQSKIWSSSKMLFTVLSIYHLSYHILCIISHHLVSWMDAKHIIPSISYSQESTSREGCVTAISTLPLPLHSTSQLLTPKSRLAMFPGFLLLPSLPVHKRLTLNIQLSGPYNVVAKLFISTIKAGL